MDVFSKNIHQKIDWKKVIYLLFIEILSIKMQKFVIIEGKTFEYIIGRSADENHKIIDQANLYDLWFHVSNYPSCHVICKLENKKYESKLFHKIIKQGALCCKQYCKFKNVQDVSIIYTYIKNITKTKTPGQVTAKNINYISI